MYYGGMVSAQRAFSRGDAQVTVRFITDSPMLQSYLMALNTPMLAQAGGMKVERIKRQRAVVQFEGDSGTVNIVIQGTLLVQVEGNSVTLDDLRLFAEAIDYDKLGNAL
jgi:phage protein U